MFWRAILAPIPDGARSCSSTCSVLVGSFLTICRFFLPDCRPSICLFVYLPICRLFVDPRLAGPLETTAIARLSIRSRAKEARPLPVAGLFILIHRPRRRASNARSDRGIRTYATEPHRSFPRPWGEANRTHEVDTPMCGNCGRSRPERRGLDAPPKISARSAPMRLTHFGILPSKRRWIKTTINDAFCCGETIYPNSRMLATRKDAKRGGTGVSRAGGGL